MEYHKLYSGISSWVTDYMTSGVNKDKKVSYMTAHTYVSRNPVYGLNNYAYQYLTFIPSSSGRFSFSTAGMQYSVDMGNTWVTLGANEATPTVEAEKPIWWRMSGVTPSLSNGIGTFSSSTSFNVEGNLASMVWGSEMYDTPYYNVVTPRQYYPSSSSSNVFRKLFAGSKVVDASKLVLGPLYLRTGDSMTIEGAFYEMFSGCTALTTPPNGLVPEGIPQNTCYKMFAGCTSLKQVIPTISTQGASNNAFYGMYSGCTSLEEAVMPTTTPQANSHNYVFAGCSNLSRVYANWKTKPAANTTSYWALGVNTTGVMILPTGTTWVERSSSYMPVGWKSIDTDGNELLGYDEEYFTIEALGSGNIKFTGANLEYSKTGGSSWTTLNNGTNLSVSTGDKVRLKGTNASGTISASTNYNIYGNIMSLKYGDDFKSNTVLNSTTGTFSGLCANSTTLKSAKNLIMPTASVPEKGYYMMFSGCTSLATLPALPATSVGNHAYDSMFYGCSSLESIPANYLPATTLGEGCYTYMFVSCTSLVTVNKIFPSSTFSTYPDVFAAQMFGGCTSLRSADVSIGDVYSGPINKNGQIRDMFSGCTSLTSITAVFYIESGTGTFVPTYCWIDGCPQTNCTLTVLSTTWSTYWGNSMPGVNTYYAGWTVKDQNGNQLYPS